MNIPAKSFEDGSSFTAFDYLPSCNNLRSRFKDLARILMFEAYELVGLVATLLLYVVSAKSRGNFKCV